MLLKNKTAVIYAATGAVGAAVAQEFASEGANVFLTGRSMENSTGSPKKSPPPRNWGK